jgi:hypothetical protein
MFHHLADERDRRRRIPAADDDHFVVLTAVGLPQHRLVDVAPAELRRPPGPPTTCANGCG